MRSTFHVSFQHDLIIDSGGPRNAEEDPSKSVHVQINKFTPRAVGDNPSMNTTPEDFTCVFAAQIKPSEARTIASALMTAAQSVR